MSNKLRERKNYSMSSSLHAEGEAMRGLNQVQAM